MSRGCRFYSLGATVGAIELRSSGANVAHIVAVSKAYAPLTTQSASVGRTSSFFFAELIE